MQPPLMSTELFGGMFSYVEAKHMLAISLRVCVRVCVPVWYVRHHYTNSVYPNTQSPFHLILQPHGRPRPKSHPSHEI